MGQLLAPAFEVPLRGHAAHAAIDDAPVAAKKVPAAHGVQDEALLLAADDHVPDGHGAHEGVPVGDAG